MNGDMPRFLDEPDPAPAARAATPAARHKPASRLEPPQLLEALPDAAPAIGADWNPGRLTRSSSGWGSTLYAALGLGTILVTWMAFSLLSFLLGFFQVSPSLGGLALGLSVIGVALLGYAGLREWRSLRSLHQVDRLRSALLLGTDIAAARVAAQAWLRHLGGQFADTPLIAAAAQEAPDIAALRGLLRGRLDGTLRAATRSLGIRAATEVGALVAVSPHPSWDGVIVALRGLRLVRQVAQLHGMRPGPVVTVALLSRVARAAVETMTVDVVTQTAADHVLNNVPLVKHLGAMSGASTAAFRLYRLAYVAARACSPLEE